MADRAGKIFGSGMARPNLSMLGACRWPLGIVVKEVTSSRLGGVNDMTGTLFELWVSALTSSWTEDLSEARKEPKS